jgi:hypothetical protein
MAETRRATIEDALKDESIPQMKDSLWILVSFIIWGASFAMFAVYAGDMEKTSGAGLSIFFDDPTVGPLVKVCLISGVVGMVLSVAWLLVIRVIRSYIVTISVIALPVVYVGMGVYCLGEKLTETAYVFFIWAGIFVIWYIIIRSKIPFATAVLNASTQSLAEMPGLMGLQFGMSLLNLGWYIFYVLMFMAWFIAALWGGKSLSLDGFARMYVIVACLYTYTTSVDNMFAHTTGAGSVASWWVLDDSSPICNAGKRTFRYSFGSVSIASLVITFFYFIEATIGMIFDNFICRCCWDVVTKTAMYFSSYALVRVGIFGEDYCTAAGHIKDLFLNSGCQLIMSDTLVFAVVHLGAWVTAAANAGIAVGIWQGLKTKGSTLDASEFNFIIGIFGLLIGKSVASWMLLPIESACRTTIVMWADGPTMQRMRTKRPELIKEIFDGLAKGPRKWQAEVDAYAAKWNGDGDAQDEA